MTNAVTNAIAAQRAKPLSAAEHIMAERNAQEFVAVLPTHLQEQQAQAWLRLTAGALKTGKFDKDRGMYELELAALNNVPGFLQTCRRAASLGLQPGTEQFYFTTVRNNQNQGRTEILGIVGYKGYIELMYRGGHVASVIVETVHEGDQFEFIPGRDAMPIHHVDWMSRRGDLKLVYAYAKMHSGAISKVVILNSYDIDDIKSKSSSYKFNKAHSPWTTDEKSMWLKSGVRRLQTWVPWSVEIMGVGGVPIAPSQVAGAAGVETPVHPQIAAAATAAQITDGAAKLQNHDPEQVVEATLVEPDQEPPPEEDTGPPPGETGEPRMDSKQHRMMMALFSEKGYGGNTKAQSAARHAFVAKVLPGVTVDNSSHITATQGSQVIAALQALPDPEEVPSDVPSDSPAGQ